MRNLSRCFIGALFILLYTQLPAQDSLRVMDNVTVTASLLAQQQKETGRHITVIKGELFRKLPVHSIDELLRYLPGVEVQSRGPQGSQADILIRGGTFQQVLIVIDGVRLNDPLTGHFSGYIPIQPAEIERIEILKGSASAIYGSEAVGGVINIITKTFQAKSEAGKRMLAKVNTGEYKLINAELYGSVSSNKTMISGGLLSNNTEGQPLRGTRGDFHLHTASLAASRHLKNDWTASLRMAGDFRRFNAQNFYTTFTSDTAREQVNSLWAQFNLQKKTSRGRWNMDAAFKKLRDQFWFRPAAIPNDNKTSLFTAQGWYTGITGPSFNYTTGLQMIQRQIRSNDRGDHRLWHGAMYAIARHRFRGNVYMNESLRLDWDESYGWVLVPQWNLAWSPARFTLRASAGRSFRDADFTERYNNYNKAQVTSGRIGNPALQAESSWNAEAGADYALNTTLRISGTVFYRLHRNMIDWANTPYAQMPRQVNLVPNGSYALARNNERVNTGGAELDITWQKQLSDKTQLLWISGLTWLHSKNEDSIPSLYISSHAKYLANFSATLTHQSLALSLTGIYKNRHPQKAAALPTPLSSDYFVLNARLAVQCPGNHGRIYLQADNLFNTTYSDLLGSRMPGRWISGGIEIAL